MSWRRRSSTPATWNASGARPTASPAPAVARIPDDFVYRRPGSVLSNELVEKLERVQPENLGRAARIDGMTPAALSLLAVHLERVARPKLSP